MRIYFSKKRAFIMIYVLLFGALVVLTLGYLHRGAEIDTAINRNEWNAMETYYRGEAAIRVSYYEHVDEFIDGLKHSTISYIGSGREYEVTQYLKSAPNAVAKWTSKILDANGGLFELGIHIPDLKIRGRVRLLSPYFMPDSRLSKIEVQETFQMYYALLKPKENDYIRATEEETKHAKPDRDEEEDKKKHNSIPENGIYHIATGEIYKVPPGTSGIYIADGQITGDRFFGIIFDPEDRGIPKGFYGAYLTPRRRVFQIRTDGHRKRYFLSGIEIPGFIQPKLHSIISSK